jgi:hypothetical protein
MAEVSDGGCEVRQDQGTIPDQRVDRPCITRACIVRLREKGIDSPLEHEVATMLP